MTDAAVLDEVAAVTDLWRSTGESLQVVDERLPDRSVVASWLK